MTRLALALPALLAAPALAFVPWSNPGGNGSFFTYSGGGSDNGLFGNAVLIHGDTFILSTTLETGAADGLSAIAADRMQVNLLADPGQRFDHISFSETIHYTLTGPGAASAVLSGLASDLNDFSRIITTTTSTPPDLNGSGTLTLSGVIDLSAAPDWTTLQLVFNQTLTAASSPGSSVRIDASLFTFQVPAPAGALVLLLALPSRRRANTSP